MHRLAFFYDEGMLLHSNGLSHPESPERLRQVAARLRRAELEEVSWHKPREAKAEEIARVHTPEYLSWFMAQRGLEGRVDGDTSYNSGTVHAALLAAGASIQAVDAVLDGVAKRAWALVRPPGHHAESDKAMGFCFLSNAAIAAKHAIVQRGLQRVMIIDWDVHHGNGTQETLEDDPRVLFFSSHEAGLYPGTGSARETGIGAGEGYTINLPLPPGSTGKDLQLLYRAFVPALMQRYKPELVIVSAGFDAHIDDPLANLEVETRDFAALTRIVMEATDAYADGKLVFLLEGGYQLKALSDSVLACARELNEQSHTPSDGVGDIGTKVLRAASAIHRPRWPIPEQLEVPQ